MQNGKQEIQEVFPCFPFFCLRKNLSLSALADLIRVSLEYLDRETDRLFVSYTEGSLNSSAFKQQHTIIKEERNNTEKWLDQIVTERKKTEQNYYSMQFCRQGFINYATTHELTKDIADAMIDRIEVHANKDVVIYFKFEGVQFTDTSSKEGPV